MIISLGIDSDAGATVCGAGAELDGMAWKEVDWITRMTGDELGLKKRKMVDLPLRVRVMSL